MSTLAQGFGNTKCYARALGGCSREMSAEHPVSKSVLELVEFRAGKKSKSVTATGYSFQQRGVPRSFGAGKLNSKILCKKHNSLLSPFDREGKKVFAGMDAVNDAAGIDTSPQTVVDIDGDRFERWMLKVLCGGLYSGNFPITENGDLKGVCPPPDYLQILFKNEEFRERLGLYHLPSKPGEIVETDPQVLKFEVLASADGGVGGLRAWFFSFEFALLMANLVPGIPTLFDRAMFRPKGFRVLGSNTRIRFHWRGGPASGDAVVSLVFCRDPNSQ